MFTASRYFPDDPRPQVREFVDKFKAKYGKEPDAFNAYAYDTMVLMAQVMREFGPDRKSIHDGLGQGEGRAERRSSARRRSTPRRAASPAP